MTKKNFSKSIFIISSEWKHIFFAYNKKIKEEEERKKKFEKKKSKIFSKVEIFSKIKSCSYKKKLVGHFLNSFCDKPTDGRTDGLTNELKNKGLPFG